MDRGAWLATIYGVTELDTTEWLSTHAMEYLLGIKKEWNNAICSDMDKARDYCTKWSKSDRERQNICNSLNVELKKMIQMNLYIKHK